MLPPLLHLLLVLGALISLASGGFYVREMLKGQVKPNRVTWFLWTLIPFIAFFASLREGATWSTVATFMSGFTPLVIFCASFLIRGPYWNIRSLDYLCGVLSLLALWFWHLTQEGIYAVTLAILADCIAGLPTLIKAWRHPESEADFTFIGGLITSILSLFAVQAWSVVEYGFPLYLLLMNTLLILVIRLRR